MSEFQIGSPVWVEVVTYNKRGQPKVIGDEISGLVEIPPDGDKICIYIPDKGLGFYDVSKVRLRKVQKK